jgi:biopolymer transport protein ExbD
MKKRDIILDFTSLLDVIMILLFIVMSNTAVSSANVSEELTEAKSEISELEYKLQTQSAAEESYAIGSARDEVKAAAKHIAPPLSENGETEVLLKLLEELDNQK